jgi:hypothetical protein
LAVIYDRNGNQRPERPVDLAGKLPSGRREAPRKKFEKIDDRTGGYIKPPDETTFLIKERKQKRPVGKQKGEQND